ncbi:TetR/AcrR family transcriptional regulator [Pannus brasiliensis CCIBt3594]|uniref:TetR/AcrR family transcriptional regulator n=1 Tax=Pannus brasiliensis CCIBt3594 TaxID=1427578 RepID=A0AAW9QRC6_9CHRO
MNTLTPKRQITRTRLIEAGTEVFAREGVLGATTREIARVAGVNEVTLFRYFPNKEELLAAVIEGVSARQVAILSERVEWTGEVEPDIRAFAHLYNTMLEDNEALIRTFIGEAKRYPEAARRILVEAAAPLRERLVFYLREAIKRGTVRRDIKPKLAVDLFAGTLLAGMLRRTLNTNSLGYSPEDYLETSITFFCRAITE